MFNGAQDGAAEDVSGVGGAATKRQRLADPEFVSPMAGITLDIDDGGAGSDSDDTDDDFGDDASVAREAKNLKGAVRVPKDDPKILVSLSNLKAFTTFDLFAALHRRRLKHASGAFWAKGDIKVLLRARCCSCPNHALGGVKNSFPSL